MMKFDLNNFNNIRKELMQSERSAKTERIQSERKRRSESRLINGKLPKNMREIIYDQSDDIAASRLQTTAIYSDSYLGKMASQVRIETAVQTEWYEILGIYEDRYLKGQRIPKFIKNMLLDIRAASTLFNVLYDTFNIKTPNIINLIVSNFIMSNKSIQEDNDLYNLYLDFYYTVNGYRADVIQKMITIDDGSVENLILFLPKYGKLSFSDIKSGTFNMTNMLYESQIDPDITLEGIYNMMVILYGRNNLNLAAIFILLESYVRKFKTLSDEKKKLWHKLTTVALDIVENDYNIRYHIGVYVKELRKQTGEKRLSLRSIDSNKYPNISKTIDLFVGNEQFGKLL